MKAINIKWDTDGDESVRATLPSTVELPREIFSPQKFESSEELLEAVSNWLSDEYGFCHDGFSVRGLPKGF